MRRQVTVNKLKKFMQELAMASKGAGSVYLVGGSTALLLNLREQTVDIDLKLDPEPDGAFEAIAKLKNDLDVNVELASPDDFIPVPADWKEKSLFIETINKVSFYHFDIASQALAKIERGHTQDLEDVRSYLTRGIISAEQITERFTEALPMTIRYPAIDARQFGDKVTEFLLEVSKNED